MITNPVQKIFFFQIFALVKFFEQLDRFEVDVVEKPLFMLLSVLSNFIRNCLHLMVAMGFGVSDIPRCINDVPKYLVLKSLNDVSVALVRAPPELYAVGPHRLQYFQSYIVNKISIMQYHKMNRMELVYLDMIDANLDTAGCCENC